MGRQVQSDYVDHVKENQVNECQRATPDVDGPASRVGGVYRQLRRLVTGVVTMVLVSVSIATVSTSSAAAAAPAYFIRSGLNQHCLDQHYNDEDKPTTTVYAYYNPCHYAGNQQWTFEVISGNTYRIKNARSGWCLSAPNGSGSRVFTEYCNNMDKQKWTAALTPLGQNTLKNKLSGDCLNISLPIEVWVTRCYPENSNQNWYWYSQD